MATYIEALQAAGYYGLPFGWLPDGTCLFQDTIPQADQEAIRGIFAAHADEAPFVILVPNGTPAQQRQALDAIPAWQQQAPPIAVTAITAPVTPLEPPSPVATPAR
jgi:hypothetical protein